MCHQQKSRTLPPVRCHRPPRGSALSDVEELGFLWLGIEADRVGYFHKVQKLLPNGKPQFTIVGIIAEGVVRPYDAPNGGERLVHRCKFILWYHSVHP
jgi:hypothetical protein